MYILIMNAKDKAKELCLKYQRLLFINISDRLEEEDYIHPDSIKCAKIAVDEILISIESAQFRVWHHEEMTSEFWNEVTTELDALT